MPSFGAASIDTTQEAEKPDDEGALTANIMSLATQYGRYGYRRITAMLRQGGWRMNAKRVARIWRRVGLKVPSKPPKRGRLWLNEGPAFDCGQNTRTMCGRMTLSKTGRTMAENTAC